MNVVLVVTISGYRGLTATTSHIANVCYYHPFSLVCSCVTRDSVLWCDFAPTSSLNLVREAWQSLALHISTTPLENLEQGSLSHGCTVAAGSAPGSVSEVVWFLQVVGAKVVTNARSPGARCYGFVTMSTAEEATKCISHLHKTELHGKMISVEKVGGLLLQWCPWWCQCMTALAFDSPAGQK